MFHAGATLNILKALLREFQQTSAVELHCALSGVLANLCFAFC
jgi:ABC-type molybdate transport system substrate-binding protein